MALSNENKDFNFYGSFDSIEQVWSLYPTGGSTGSYVIIKDEKYYWEESYNRWQTKDGILPPDQGGSGSVIDGSIELEGDLTARDVIARRDMKAGRNLFVSQTATITDIITATLNVIGKAYAKDIILKGDISSENFAEGLLGWFIKQSGYAQLKGLKLLEFLEVPELRYNRVRVITGEEWNAPGGGIIEDVDTENKIITLKLEDGEYGSVDVDDLCKGIYHHENGFYTIWFTVTEILEESNISKFRYELRDGYDYHPTKFLNFVAFGNKTNKDRQMSSYSTRSYTRYLAGVNDWDITVDMIMMQFGDLSNLRVYGIDMTGYSAYLQNIYMTGVVRQISSDGNTSNRIPCPKGLWEKGTYYYYDQVSNKGAIWVCIKESTTQEPTEGCSDWEKWVSEGEKGYPGNDGSSPFKSTVFIRSNEKPDSPTGGSYDNPIPNGWYDGIPNGEEILWASTRIFTADGTFPQQDEWSEPSKMTNTSDFDIIYSDLDEPSNPIGHPNTNQDWYNEANESTIWMAISQKKNGIWEDWKISKIKGEKGDQGNDGIQGAALRPRGIWSITETYVRNEEFIDYVIYGDNRWVYVVKKGVNNITGIPPTDTNYWEQTNQFDNVATSVLLADNAYIDILGTSGIRIGNYPNCWEMTAGSIVHRVSGLSLTADGVLSAPDGLHIKIGDDTIADFTDQKIQTSVTEEVSKIEIGGRNLVLKSDQIFTARINTKTYDMSKTWLSLKGKTVAISFDYSYTSATTDSSNHILWFEQALDTDTGTSYALSRGISLPITSTPISGSGRFTGTAVVPSNIVSTSTTKVATLIIKMTGGSGTITNFKIEEGNKSTDWSPAPEDAKIYTDDVINNLQIGGRNYLLNSSLSSKMDWTQNGATPQFVTLDGVPCMSIVAGTGGIASGIYRSIPSGLKTATTITLSIDVYVTAVGGYMFFGVESYGVDDAKISYTFKDSDVGKWQRISVTGIPQNKNVVIYTYGNTQPVYYKNVKGERGNKATDWTPAPEDVQAELDSKVAVTVYESGITQLQSSINSKVSQTDFNALGNRVSAVETEIIQTPNKITQAIKETSIGGDNLLPNLQQRWARGRINSGTGAIEVPSGTGWSYVRINIYCAEFFPVNGGETLVFSAPTDKSYTCFPAQYDASKTFIPVAPEQYYMRNYYDESQPDNLKILTLKPQTRYVRWQIQCSYGSNSGDFYPSWFATNHAQVEIGNKPTAYKEPFTDVTYTGIDIQQGKIWLTAAKVEITGEVIAKGISTGGINIGNGNCIITSTGLITAKGATIEGKITATSGSIGGVSISGNRIGIDSSSTSAVGSFLAAEYLGVRNYANYFRVDASTGELQCTIDKTSDTTPALSIRNATTSSGANQAMAIRSVGRSEFYGGVQVISGSSVITDDSVPKIEVTSTDLKVTLRVNNTGAYITGYLRITSSPATGGAATVQFVRD